MGLDLTILPFDGDYDEPMVLKFSHTLLDCERRQELFEAILGAEAEKGVWVGEKFTTYLARDKETGETIYGKVPKTPYGDKLLYLTAEQLMQFSAYDGVMDNNKNRAVWAYLACLPGATKVALYWH